MEQKKISYLNLGQLQKYLIYEFSSEAELLSSIERISENFTTKRENISEYSNDKKMVAAYTCFYLLTNLPKLEESFKKIEIEIDDYKDFDFIDIGSGPGTFSFALLSMNPLLKVMALEKSKVMIEQGESLLHRHFPNNKVEFYESLSSMPKKTKKRFGVFGHSANEMSVGEVLSIIEILALDEILFIEPGTKDFFSKSLDIRKILSRKYNQIYPCFCSKDCPLEKTDWCHQYFEISHAQDTERLTQLAKKDRRHAPGIIHFYTKNDPHSYSEQNARIIRLYPPTKFSVEWQFCSKVEGENKVFRFQMLTRGLKRAEIKNLKSLLAGDRVELFIEKEFEGILRGRVYSLKPAHGTAKA